MESYKFTPGPDCEKPDFCKNGFCYRAALIKARMNTGKVCCQNPQVEEALKEVQSEEAKLPPLKP